MLKALPEKYYLTHFHELQGFIAKTSFHLLTPPQQALFAELGSLDEECLCLLLRIINRKRVYVTRAQLNYAEIKDTDAALNELRSKGLVQSAHDKDADVLLGELTKEQLQLIASELIASGKVSPTTPAKSAKKALWSEFVYAQCANVALADTAVFRAHLSAPVKADFEYWLFLFFGKLGGTLQQFSLRDLGVMQTRQGVSSGNAHFSELAEAQSAYFYVSQNKHLNNLSLDDKVLLAKQIYQEQVPAAEGLMAQTKRDDLTHKLACQLDQEEPALATVMLKVSNHPKAQEKYIRALYTAGDYDTCLAQLEEVLACPQNEELLIFAEDFSALKFTTKRTSVLTDILRQSGPPIALDEAYVGYPEQGAIAWYHRQGNKAYHGENQFWRMLFVLVFWPALYESTTGAPSNEFDLTPRSLKYNQFYEVHSDHIEQILGKITDNQSLFDWLLRQASAHFGKPNRLVFWHRSTLDLLLVVARLISVTALKTHLVAMCKDYKMLKDGYPDLICIDDSDVSFVEIKAPGDSLRRNQLVTIRRLIESGFKVDIQQVCWQIAPQQAYVVIDVETTGGKKEFDRITEIAMVRIVDGKVVKRWQSLINPLRRIPKYITELTGISNEMVADAPLFSDVAQQVEDFMQDAIFVAHNVNFDMGFIKAEFARIDQVFQKPKLCTVQLGRKWLPGMKSYALNKICAELGITLTQHHRAMADAEATAQLFILINQVRLENQE
ncbi:DNA polymerase III subunit epsilon [Pseudoalteromonas rubra]|uniref:DNA-directed DNA polymerase n=1 Tax=Pseudoalteromonas rubra TaxID=43658 RepID=A0A5S3WK25_9GAMM|nr:exonuclease domain-containing protein [Pseudoalteromonas rubra]TMP27751.1 DNA polymerase III subunit epsilon [Pseudoalteromonas rubra]TMP32479.1 DNA polymerase III subunit epsilon [Pseudoalteromonas rubra]